MVKKTVKNNMSKKEAYDIVFKDFMQCPLFCGEYDHKNGNDNFMYGIATVGEWLACGVSEEMADDYSEMFTNNMVGGGVVPQ